jgi:hypothetical protein
MTSESNHMTTAFPWTDVSIDIETLGKKYNAPLLAIGAAAFSRVTGKVGPTYYQEVDIDSAIKSGVVDASTVAWWIDQSKGAKKLFDTTPEGTQRKMHLASALSNFCTWGRSLGAPRVWGNGATFDITIIEHALDKGSVGISAFWHYGNIRDMRTIVDAAQMVSGQWTPANVVREGVHHNAVDDAVHQAKVIIEAWAALGVKFEVQAKTKPAKRPAPTPVQAPDDDEDDL